MIARVIDFCEVESMGRVYEVETIKVNDIDEGSGLYNVEINGIDMLMKKEELEELLEDLSK